MTTLLNEIRTLQDKATVVDADALAEVLREAARNGRSRVRVFPPPTAREPARWLARAREWLADEGFKAVAVPASAPDVRDQGDPRAGGHPAGLEVAP